MFSYQLYTYPQLVQPQMPISLAQMNTQTSYLPQVGPVVYMASPGYLFPQPHLESIHFYKQTQNSSLQGSTHETLNNLAQRYLIQQKSVKRVQNPYRNIYTNITNLILNFIISNKKVQSILERVDSTLIDDKLEKFYKYIKDLKNQFSAYFNLQKVKKLFLGTSLLKYNKQLHKLFRIVVKIILEEKIPTCLMTSKRLSSELRAEHLRARRSMLGILCSNSLRQKCR